MSLRSAMIYWLVAALAISPVMAQSSQSQADPERWRAFAAQLPPNALVTVHLMSGDRVEGHVVQVTTDTLQINPKTASRIPASVRDLPFDVIQSIDREHEGMSTSTKVLIWTVIGLGAFAVFWAWCGQVYCFGT